LLADQPHILFTSTFHSSFVDEDIRLLEKNFNVTTAIVKGWTASIIQLGRLLTAQITFSWFASTYSSFLIFFARLLGKRSVLVLGGADVAKEKELNYGIWNSWWKSPIVRYGIRHATVILAVDQFLKDEAVRLAKYSGNNIIVVPTGYDPEYWKALGRKEPLVLTVASCPDMMRVKLKGIDIFIAAARKMADVRFAIIGIDAKVASSLNIPSNVDCLPFLQKEEIKKWYQRAKVYCQLSIREGFPNAVCEAMLCECIPVGTNVGGIPSAVGDAGLLVDYDNVPQTVDAIRAALTRSSKGGAHARKRIAERFTLAQRERALLETIGKLSP
jgi:glycosyltransferase involved in cell wall biosynthesis